MATPSNNALVIVNGIPQNIGTDSLAVTGGLENTPIGTTAPSSAAFTAISASTMSISDDASIGGDLTVAGDIISRGAVNLVVQDAFIDLGAGNSSTTASSGGFTLSMNRAAAFAAGTVTAFTAGVAGVSNPSFTYTNTGSSSLLAAGDVVFVGGSLDGNNDGIFVVQAVNQASFPQAVTVKGIGTVAINAATPWAQNQFTTSTGNAANAYKIDLSVLAMADGSNAFKSLEGVAYAKGTLLTAYAANATEGQFTPDGSYAPPASSNTLQDAYDLGNTIATAGAQPIAFTLTRGDFTVSGGGSVKLGDGVDLAEFSVNAGTASINTSGVMGLSAGGDLNIIATAGTIAVGTDISGSITLTSVENIEAIAQGYLMIGAESYIAINSGSGNILIGSDPVNGAISIASDGVRTVTLGSGADTTFDANLGATTIDASTLSIDATGASNFTVTGANLSMGTATSGDVTFAAAGAMTIDAASSLEVNSAGPISIANDAVNQAVNVATAGTRTVTLGAGSGTTLDANLGATTIDASTLSIDATGASNLTVTGAGLTVSTVTSGDVAVESAGAVDVDAVANVQINSSTGAIQIANDNANGAVDFATSGTRTVTLGAGAGTTFDANLGAATIDAGALSIDATDDSNLSVTNGDLAIETLSSGDMSISSAGTITVLGSGDVSVNSSGGQIKIANEAVNQDVFLATQGTRTLNVGAGASTTLNADFGDATIDAIGLSIDAAASSNITVTGGNLSFGTASSGDMTVSSAGTMDVDAVGALQINSAASISIANDNVNQAVGFATGGTRTVTLGAGSSTTLDANLGATTIDASTLSIDATGASNFTVTGANLSMGTATSGDVTFAAAGAMTIDAASSLEVNSAGPISIANDAVNQAVNVATAGTRTVTVGAGLSTTFDANFGAITIDASTLAIASTDTTSLVMSANAAGNKALTIQALNTGAGNASVSISAKSNVGLTATNGNIALTASNGTSTVTVKDNQVAAFVVKGDLPVLTINTLDAVESVEVDGFLKLTKNNGSGAMTVSAVAGEALLLGDLVAISGAAGKAFKVNAGSATDAKKNVWGVAIAAASTDASTALAISGIATIAFTANVATTDIGKIVYASTSDGLATLTAPSASGSRVYKVGMVAGASGSSTAQVLIQPQLIANIF